MPPQIDLFCIGFAAVVDTVLLLVVLARINRPLTAVWLKSALAGVTLWHVGSFLHATLKDANTVLASQADMICMTCMATGLILQTCGLLHAALRIDRSGGTIHPAPDWKYLIVYSPLLLAAAVSVSIVRSDSRDFIVATDGYHELYLTWLTLANTLVSWLLIRNRNESHRWPLLLGRFLIQFSLGLLIVTALTVIYVVWATGTSWERPLRLVTTLSPIIPTLVFAYYVFWRRLLPMVFERTLVYGAFLVAMLYLHRLTLSPLVDAYSQKYHFDFFVVEGLLAIVLVLSYAPLRERCRESLRYLLGGDVGVVRNTVRQLSVELSRRGRHTPEELSQWFVRELTAMLKLRYACLCVSSEDGDSSAAYRSSGNNDPDHGTCMTEDECHRVCSFFDAMEEPWVDRSRCTNPKALAMMRQTDLMAVLSTRDQTLQTMLLIGSPTSGDRLADEQLNAVLMLVEQYAAITNNYRLEQMRQVAERRAVQQEKLSTLGLISGSLAHEIRNPLSSIRTVATLLKEDLADDSEKTHDLELIVSEIDRLTQTTQRLLDYSRPADSTDVGVAPDMVVERLLHIMTHLARQHSVSITTELNLGSLQVDATDATLSEILFNLIRNAIEAVRGSTDPAVMIRTELDQTSETDREAVITIKDNGPGIPADIRDEIFTPFVTGKADGTGLGLYLVAERVRELQGTVSCVTDETGTQFSVRLAVHSGTE